jgi:hypothetical protein
MSPGVEVRIVCLTLCVFALVQASVESTFLFAAAMGLSWLATVPLTNAILATVYGVNHLSLFSGITFFFHQVRVYAGGEKKGYSYSFGFLCGATLLPVVVCWKGVLVEARTNFAWRLLPWT